ncbi:hypothetical protein [Streptosporangium canum]
MPRKDISEFCGITDVPAHFAYDSLTVDEAALKSGDTVLDLLTSDPAHYG